MDTIIKDVAAWIIVGLIALVLYFLRSDRETQGKFKEAALEEMQGIKSSYEKLSYAIDRLNQTIKESGQRTDDRVTQINKRIEELESEVRKNRDRFYEINTTLTAISLQAENKGWKLGSRKNSEKE